MRKHWDQREGILLQSIPYLESRRILKVFTKDAGLLLIIAGTKKAPFASPFCRAEWVYRISSNELHSLKDSTLLDPMLRLKESFEMIEAASAIAGDLLRSQLPNKASHGLYELLLASLTHLPSNPKAIAQSFRLKLLQFEGLLRIQTTCTHCGAPATHLAEGESVCPRHASSAISFTPTEWALLLSLGLARRFSELSSLEIPALFAHKSKELLSRAIR